MKLQSFLSTPVFFVVAMVMAGCYLAAAAFPALQNLEWVGFAAALVIVADVVGGGIARWRLVRTRTPARGWASRLFDAPPPERDDRIWSPEQLAAIKASMEAGEPHRFNLIDAPGVRERYPADFIGEFKPRALDEMTPIPELAIPTPELPDPPDLADAFEAGMLPPMNIRREFAARIAEHNNRMARRIAEGSMPTLAASDRAAIMAAELPKTGHDSEILATTTLPTGSDFTQEAHSSDVSGDSQLLDKDRDEWGNEVHGAVKALVESDGVALTPHEEADLRALRLLRPDPAGDSRAKHRSRYWEDRYDAMNPEITEDQLQRRMLDRPTDAASVRKAVAAVTNELRTYAPPSLQLAGPEAIPQLGGALVPVEEVQHLAMVRVADVGALAVSLAVDNDHLRNELNASMAMRQEASRQLAAMDLNEDGRHPSEDLGAMSRADAKKLCIAMGWLIQQETVAVWAEPSDYD